MLLHVSQIMLAASQVSCTPVRNVSQSIKAMKRERSQLISARVDPATIAKIDKFLTRHTYWKRNTVIASVLDAVFDNFTDADIYDMVRYNGASQFSASASFTLK